jgi:hypothetical protein
MNNDFDLQEIKERAHDKAFAKITLLNIERNDLLDDIVNDNTGVVSIETLEQMYRSCKKEIRTWNYIASLIEKDNV